MWCVLRLFQGCSRAVPAEKRYHSLFLTFFCSFRCNSVAKSWRNSDYFLNFHENSSHILQPCRVKGSYRYDPLPCRVRRLTSPCPPPLRTHHVGFPSMRSSLLQLAELTHLVHLLMAGFVQMYQILCSVCATILHRHFVMNLQFLSVKQVCFAHGTLPVLVLSHVA